MSKYYQLNDEMKKNHSFKLMNKKCFYNEFSIKNVEIFIDKSFDFYNKKIIKFVELLNDEVKNINRIIIDRGFISSEFILHLFIREEVYNFSCSINFFNDEKCLVHNILDGLLIGFLNKNFYRNPKTF